MARTDLILEKLIQSCLCGDATLFLPYLLKPNVHSNMPNKVRFYLFFKHMLKCSKAISQGPWKLEITTSSWSNNSDAQLLSFYDSTNKSSRLNIEVINFGDALVIETLPF